METVMAYFETPRQTVTEEGPERETARGRVSEKEEKCIKKSESADADRHGGGYIDGNTSCADMLRESNTSSHQDLFFLEIVTEILKKRILYIVVQHESSLFAKIRCAANCFQYLFLLFI